VDVSTRDLRRAKGDGVSRSSELVSIEMRPNPRQRCFTGACRAFGMGVQCMTSHLDEDAGPVLDMLTKEFDREVFRLNEKCVATLRALRRNARL
jgi:hypothetical protein